MSGMKRLISIYLTVAVILTLAISCFGTKGIAIFRVPVQTPTENSIVTQVAVTESTAEAESAPLPESANPQEEAEDDTKENTSAETVTEVMTETETEAVTEAIPETERLTEIVTEKAEENEDEPLLTFSEILKRTPALGSSYTPDKTLEKVTPLLFLSENIDALTTADSVNVYTFTAERRAVFSYTFTHDAPETAEGWEISLYCEYSPDGDGKSTAFRLVDTRKTTVLTVDSSPELGLAPGNYRLVVKKGNLFDSKSYRIDAKLTETSGYEIECNDNIYRYTEIYSGVPVKGSASCFTDRQDEDYYLLRMYEDGFIDLQFEHPAVKDKISVCWQILLFSEDGTCIYSANSLFTDTINKSGKIGLTKGNYYVLIRNRVYTDITYTLTLSRTGNTDYETEKNDTLETANLIGIGSTLTGTVASQINGIDRDYFRFSIPSNGNVVIDFAHEPISDSNDKNGWNIILLDSEENILYKGISAWADDVTVSTATGLGKGVYYIRIDSENLHRNSDKYYLTVHFTENADCETEFNNSFNTADILPEHSPVTGNITENNTDYDSDYFVIDLAEDSDVLIEFSHETLSVSREIFNFTLYDGNLKKIASFSEEGEGATVIKSLSDVGKAEAVYKNLPAGRYYIKVTAGLFYSEIQYSLSYTKGE